MATLSYKEFSSYIQNKDRVPVYLIYGDDFLYKNALKELLDVFVPEPIRDLNYEPVEGENENIPNIIESLNTFSLLPGTRVIGLLNSKIFYSQKIMEKLVEKLKEASDQKDLPKAGKQLIALLNTRKMSLSDLHTENRPKTFTEIGLDINTDSWLEPIADYCIEENLKVSDSYDYAQLLSEAIEKGFATDNYLVITADTVDKRKVLFKTIETYGLIVDCEIPKGHLKADKDEQEKVLREQSYEILSKHKKTMTPDAFGSLMDMIGTDLRSFMIHIEKLISYTGTRKSITEQDVENAIERTSQDPIYKLTNAFAERKTVEIIIHMKNLMENDFAALQILHAFVNQTRKMLIIKSFLESGDGKNWHDSMNFQVFQRNVWPFFQEYEKSLQHLWEYWHTMIADRMEQPTKKGKQVPQLSLLFAKSVYPVFNLFSNSKNYSARDLVNAMQIFKEADKRLKSTGQNDRFVLEDTIFQICRRSPLSKTVETMRFPIYENQ